MDFPDFAVAVGEEGSDPLVPFRGEIVRVDEYAASGHDERMAHDLADVAALGIGLYRYGMPWRLTEPAPGEYDWALWDRAFAALDAAGMTPIVDLLHFGLPDHFAGFCSPDWVDGFVRYADAFLARYPAPRFFTPVNEPMITALMSARLGAWNDCRATDADFGLALAHVTLANLEVVRRVREERDGWWIGSEGFESTFLLDPGRADEAAARRATLDLVWDLHLGVEPRPEAAATVAGIPSTTRDRIDALAVRDRRRVVAGHDHYPVSFALLGPGPQPSLAERVAGYEAAARDWYARYAAPFWIAETSNLGLPSERGEEWLAALVSRLDAMRADGLPVRGICWYSRGDQYDWQTALTEPVGAVTEVGLFDAERVARPVAATFGALARARK